MQQVGCGPHNLDGLLSGMVARKASDLFLKPESRPVFRINGALLRTDLPAPTVADMESYLQQLFTPLAQKRFAQSPDMDLAYAIPGVGRFRINVFMHQGKLGLVARLIPPAATLDFASLHLPDPLRLMAEEKSGLILVVGPTGCGKSTALAAMIRHINATRCSHIVTIEDPIEFVHEEQRSIIHQRQVGYDTQSFATAIRHVVRQSPDVILIGELRDADTVRTAMAAALTGHLVLSSLHTVNVIQAVERMLNLFPPEARGQAQADLAETLVGLVALRLLPRADGQGRIPALEILRSTPALRKVLAEGALAEVHDLMKRNRDLGMMTLTQSLVDLCRDHRVAESVARQYAPNVDEFLLNLEGMYTGVQSIHLHAKQPRKGNL